MFYAPFIAAMSLAPSLQAKHATQRISLDRVTAKRRVRMCSETAGPFERSPLHLASTKAGCSPLGAFRAPSAAPRQHATARNEGEEEGGASWRASDASIHLSRDGRRVTTPKILLAPRVLRPCAGFVVGSSCRPVRSQRRSKFIAMRRNTGSPVSVEAASMERKSIRTINHDTKKYKK
jgi:hypothetical protein